MTGMECGKSVSEYLVVTPGTLTLRPKVRRGRHYGSFSGPSTISKAPIIHSPKTICRRDFTRVAVQTQGSRKIGWVNNPSVGPLPATRAGRQPCMQGSRVRVGTCLRGCPRLVAAVRLLSRRLQWASARYPIAGTGRRHRGWAAESVVRSSPWSAFAYAAVRILRLSAGTWQYLR